MRGLGKLIWVEAKLYLREPAAAFFTLIFPVGMLLLFGSIYGNEPTPLLGGYGTVDVSVPAYTAMIIATTAFVGLSITVASYRERGVLRRLGITPLRPEAVLAAQVAVLLVMTALGMVLLIIEGKLVYGLHFLGNPASVFLAFVLSCLSMFALGFVLAGLAPTARSAQVIGMGIFYPMIFLSGAGFPRELLPETIRKYSVVLPLTHVVTLLKGLWLGDSWGQHLTEVVVLLALLALGVAVSSRTFRWE